MKRFLSLLTVFALAFALAVPVGAVNDDTFLYNGYECPDIESVWDKTVYPYAYIVDGYLYLTKDEPNFGGFDGGISTYATNWCWYFVEDGKWVLGNVGKNNTTVTQESGVQWVSFGEYYTKPVSTRNCDGSSCPATDENIDGICDDCGMTLMSLSRSPVAPDVTGSNKNYVMFYSGTVYQYTAYTSDSSYAIRGEEYGARYRTYLEPAVTATRFQSYDGINWEQTYNGTTANDYPGEIGWELISSTYDWYTEEGDRFFPVPLWEEVQTVTQGEMSNLTTETAGTMTTLVVCGVGLMACLVALSLFGKRWLLFLR